MEIVQFHINPENLDIVQKIKNKDPNDYWSVFASQAELILHFDETQIEYIEISKGNDEYNKQENRYSSFVFAIFSLDGKTNRKQVSLIEKDINWQASKVISKEVKTNKVNQIQIYVKSNQQEKKQEIGLHWVKLFKKKSEKDEYIQKKGVKMIIIQEEEENNNKFGYNEEIGGQRCRQKQIRKLDEMFQLQVPDINQIYWDMHQALEISKGIDWNSQFRQNDYQFY